jgi:hypothetical protein
LDEVFLNSLLNPHILHLSLVQFIPLSLSLSLCSPSYKVLGQLPDTDVYIDIDAYEEVGLFIILKGYKCVTWLNKQGSLNI